MAGDLMSPVVESRAKGFDEATRSLSGADSRAAVRSAAAAWSPLSRLFERVQGAFLLPATIFIALFLIPPFLFVFVTSFYDQGWSLDAYRKFFSGQLFLRSFVNTITIGATTAMTATTLGYVVAYHLAKCSPRRRAIYLILVMLPFWTSVLVKSFAFVVILGTSGVINTLIKSVFGVGTGLPMIFNRTGVIIGLTHWLLPFAVFPILSSLLAQDRMLPVAAEVMGAGRFRIFWTIEFRQSLPGVVASALMVAVISMGSFVTPALLGGRGDTMMANLVDFYIREALDWRMASAIAVILVSFAGLLLIALLSIKGSTNALRTLR
jgi:putative spermidine/putrescine transport system permease protein